VTRRGVRLVPVAFLCCLATACAQGAPVPGGTPGGSTGTSSTGTSPLGVVPAGTPAPGGSWTMPQLVGRNLQDAQDAIQSLTHDTVYLTRSHDATGRNRHQVLDRDWKVCTQNVAPGASFTAATTIDFGAVKSSESCP
jgi:hypothetical protein